MMSEAQTAPIRKPTKALFLALCIFDGPSTTGKPMLAELVIKRKLAHG